MIITTINKIEGLKKRFYDMIVVDAFINNSDRNNGNWGIIRCSGMADRLAPIYDNGGSFNGKTPDSRLCKILETEKYDAIALNGISVYGKDGVNFLTRDILKFDNTDLKLSICDLFPNIKNHMDEIHDLINEIPDEICSPIRKEFYNKSLDLRLDMLLAPSFELAKSKIE